jgi:hypothetical protein
MGPFALLGVLCLILACTAVGLRLILLGVRRWELPELALGAGYLLFGSLGYPLAAVARASAAAGTAHAGAWLAAALAIQNLGVIACYLFTARVFRPGRVGGGIAVTGALLLLASWIGHGFDPGWPGARSGGPWYYLGLATRAAAFVWCAAESLSYWARLRRRLRIGLADPVVVDRMWLWGASSLAIALGFAIFAAGTLSPGGVNATPVVLGVSACGLAASLAMTLAFFPPAAYRRRLERGARSA